MGIRLLDLFLAGTAALGLSDILGGCVVGPDFVRPVPSVAASATYVEPAPGRPVHTSLPLLRGTTDAPPDVEWWRAFRDPVLDGLEGPDQAVDEQSHVCLPLVVGAEPPKGRRPHGHRPSGCWTIRSRTPPRRV